MLRLSIIWLIILFGAFDAKSQCCNGTSIGNELVVNGDFANGNFGFSTSYEYAKTPGLGRYGITTNAKSVHPQFWFACTGHGSGQDSFMWVDLSGSSSVNIWTQKVINIKPNRYYVFSAWVNTLGDEGPGTLQFSINNKLVGKPLRAPFTMCNWVKFCYLWYSSKNTSAILNITNQSSGGSGNDVGIDNISFTEFQPSFTLSKIVNLCSGDGFILPNGLLEKTSGMYLDTLKNYFGCDSIDAIRIIVHPSYDLKVDVSLCKGESYMLPDGKIVTTTGQYYHKLKTTFGCDSFISTNIVVHENLQLDYSKINVSCYGYKDGVIKFNMLSGRAPFKYNLSNLFSNTIGVFDKLFAGTYQYSISDANGCSVDGEIIVEQPDKILIKIRQSEYTVDLNSLVYVNTSTNYPNCFFDWKPNILLTCDSCADIVITADSNITYKLAVSALINGNICKQDTTVSIRIKPFVFVPNAFTPNADKLNDNFVISGNYFESFENIYIEIYNRWGEKMIEGNNANFEWDGTYNGKLVSEGVYFYCIKYKMKNRIEIIQLRGTFTVLR